MFQIYFCIGIVMLSLALSVGLISGFAITRAWPKIPDKILYLLDGIIVAIVASAAIRLIYFLKKNNFFEKIEKELKKNK